LTASGLVEKTSVLHDRATYYVFPDASLERRMQAGIQSSQVFKKVTEQGLAALPAGDLARTRMEMSIEWSDLLVEHFEKAISEWRGRYPDLSRK